MDILQTFSAIGGSELSAFFKVMFINLILSADNILVVGLVAASLPAQQRKKAIFIGTMIAVVFLILFASITVQLLNIPGVLLIGSLLLFYVAYKIWNDLKQEKNMAHHKLLKKPKPKTFTATLWQISIAYVSMSIDNILASASASKDHPLILIFSLVLAICLMATIATYMTRWLKKYPIIGYAGFMVVIYIACELLYEGGKQLLGYF
ncbi:MAG: YjbE family putative metal transport protein [Alphaproteobacteria bacterium]